MFLMLILFSQIPDSTRMVSLYSVTARFLRIYPQEWKGYPCLNVEMIGCPAEGNQYPVT